MNDLKKLKAMFPGLEKLTEDQLRTMLVMTGVLSFMFLSGPGKKPAWLKDAPPAFERLAGPWRGKGSFGKAPFGSQSRRR